MSEPVVAVLGAYGAVGRATARALHGHVLRLGGRDPEATRALAAELESEAWPVDLWDDDALAGFCAGVSLVVNAAGPSFQVLDRVARVALAAGADYVDPGGDQPLYDRLVGEPDGGRVVVLNAGLMPGLTAVLPRWLAGRLGEPAQSMTTYVGLVDRFTPVGAAEYLLTLGGGHGEAQAVWRGGSRLSHAAAPQTEVELPGFPGRVALHPYLSLETERTARDLGLDRVDWWNVFDGAGHVVTALSRLQGAMRGGELESAALELCAAARLDLFGQPPYQRIDCAMVGVGGRTGRVSMDGSDTYAITAAVTIATARRVLEARVPPGVWFVEQALDAEQLVAELRTEPAVTRLDHGGAHPDEPDQPDGLDEGEL